MPTKRRTYKTGTTRRVSGTPTKTYNRSTTRTATHTASYSPTQYNNYRKECQARIGSYRMLNQQFSGAGKVTAFSPTVANRWVKWANDGCRIYKFSQTQFSGFFGAKWNNPTPTAACRFLKNKFGNGIKAVTRGKGNYWLVAATPRVTARPFSTYNWK